MRVAPAWSLLLVATLAGCAGPLADARAAYDAARYPEALVALREVELDAARWKGERRARYALERGLTHVGLGDLDAAARWLGEARAAADADPGLFDDEDVGRLASAWAHLR